MKVIFKDDNGVEAVFASISSENHYLRGLINEFILISERIPFSNFMIFDSNHYNFINKNNIKAANLSLLKRADQLWVFGEVNNGVKAEIEAFKSLGKPIKLFDMSFKEIPLNGEFRNANILKNKRAQPLIYTLTPKNNFYHRLHINKFVLENRAVPINPHMIFDSYMTDILDKEALKTAHENFLKKSDEVWVFENTDDLIEDIKLAKKLNKPVVYYDINQVKGLI